MRQRCLNFVSITLVMMGAGACDRSPTNASPSSREAGLHVAVSIAPLSSLVEPMLPPGSRISIILPVQSTPHAEELTPSRVLNAAEADVLFYIGGGADPVVERIAKARMRRGLRTIALDEQALSSSSDGGSHHHHDHDHAGGHPWLHPHLLDDAMPRVAEMIRASLSDRNALTEANAARVESGLDIVRRDIDEVDRAYAHILGALRGSRFISVHGAFDVILREYGLTPVVTIQPGHGVEPGAGALATAIDFAANDPEVFVIIESNITSAVADRLAEQTGIRVARLDPSGASDWERMMRSNLQAILVAIQAAPAAPE